MKRKKIQAIAEIFILIVGIMAISYAVGSNLEIVSAYKNESGNESRTGDYKSNTEGSPAEKIEEAPERTTLTLKEFLLIKSLIPKELSEKIEKKIVGKKEILLKEFTTEEIGEIDKAMAGTEVAEKTGHFFNLIPRESWGGFAYRTMGHVIANGGIAVGIYLGINYLGTLVTDDANIQRAFDRAAKTGAWTFFATNSARQAVRDLVVEGGKLAGTKFASFFATKFGAFLISPGFGWVAAGAGIIISVLTFKNERQQIITFDCNIWDAEIGGADCEKCNSQRILPCTEYQCKSLGQGCELINKGESDEKCVWISRNDTKYPTITPWNDALISEDYEYNPDNSLSPPDRGVYVEYKISPDKCVPAFTPLSFGITLDEPAKCKFSTTRKANFDDMESFMSNGISKYNHSLTYSLPGLSALQAENITIQNDGNYELYVRCQDSNGNTNNADFVFKYCVDKGPDVTAPLIIGTSPLNGYPIAYNQGSFNVELYVNEPAECKWSKLDQNYENMENQMSCSTNLIEMNAQMLYRCTATLDGLKDRTENNFYFRCRDQPKANENDRNTNTESYEFSLIGTQPLIIDEVGPNETIKDSTPSVKVTLEAKTSAGYKDGEATCYYSETGEEKDEVIFYETGSYQHSQDLWLVEGDYEYHIRCVDLGGNADTEVVQFSVETDNEAPEVVRVYYEEGYLKIITNEESECVYSTGNVGCNYPFEDGLKMTDIDSTEHFTKWNPDTNFYIKCKDIYDNQLLRQDECSIIVRPFEIYSG